MVAYDLGSTRIDLYECICAYYYNKQPICDVYRISTKERRHLSISTKVHCNLLFFTNKLKRFMSNIAKKRNEIIPNNSMTLCDSKYTNWRSFSLELLINLIVLKWERRLHVDHLSRHESNFMFFKKVTE